VEFNSTKFKDLLREYGVSLHFAGGILKASLAERMILELKKAIHRYMTRQNTKTYWNALPDLIKGINARPQKSLKGLAPADINFE
jgi:hypothetical protein